MRRTCGISSTRWDAGMTLVEVVLGAALMGVLLTLVVLATGRFTAQGRGAAERIEACKVADRLLEEWWASSDAFPRNTRGEVPGRAGWRWRTADVKDDEQEETLGAKIMSVEVFAPGCADNAPSARVEMIVPEADRAE